MFFGHEDKPHPVINRVYKCEKEGRTETKRVREMNVDNSVLRGNKRATEKDRKRRSRVCIRGSRRERKRDRDLNHFDVSLIICCEIIFLTF